MFILTERWKDKPDWILKNMLAELGVATQDCTITHVFEEFNPHTMLGGKREGVPGLPMILQSKYLKTDYADQLKRVYRQIENAKPNVIVAMGSFATWFLMHDTKLRKIRGSVGLGLVDNPEVSRPYKILPTYSTDTVQKDWTLRPITMMDLAKAQREDKTSELNRPSRKIWVRPTLEDLVEFDQLYMQNPELVSIDIETKNEQITCVGFAPNPYLGIVVPFTSELNKSHSYWETKQDELAAWAFVRKWCRLPSLFQNGLYDIQYLWRRYGVPVPNAIEDTMLRHHAYQPEMQKGLGFLATIYTDECSWKGMTKFSKRGDE